MASVGVIPRRLPFTASNNHIRYFRHAISLDERRARFKVNLWNRPTEREHNLGVEKGTMPRHKTPPKLGDNGNSIKSPISSKSRHSTLKQLEREYSETDKDKPTDTEEVWFSGCHCGGFQIDRHVSISGYHLMLAPDIGGGSVDNGTRHSLARIPLRWMLRQCFELRTGILFHKNMFKDIGMDPDTLYPQVRARPPAIPYTPDCLAHNYKEPVNFAKNGKGTITDSEPFISEEHEDLLDSLAPIYDQLRLAKWWWILEVVPYRHRYQRPDDKWHVSRGYVGGIMLILCELLIRLLCSVNFGGPRVIPGQQELGVKVHRTVKTRMDAPDPELFKDKGYKPAAKVDIEPIWVA